jgi:hypothetical protein
MVATQVSARCEALAASVEQITSGQRLAAGQLSAGDPQHLLAVCSAGHAQGIARASEQCAGGDVRVIGLCATGFGEP